MGQIVSVAAKPKRCNLKKLSRLGIPTAGEYILVSSDNSMNATGQGNFDCYIVGDGQTAAQYLSTHTIEPSIVVTKRMLDGYVVGNLFPYAELYEEGYYVNINNGHISHGASNLYNIYILPVDGTAKYTFTNVRFALPLASDKYTATSSALITDTSGYTTVIDMSEYPNTAYIAFSFNLNTFPSSEYIVSKGTYLVTEDIIPTWFSEIIAKVFREQTVTAEMMDGYEKGNIFSSAELYAEGKYVVLTNGHIATTPKNNYNTYILPVDGVSKYTFTFARFALPLEADKYTATSQSVLANVQTIDTSEYPNTAYIAFSFVINTYPPSAYVVSKGTTLKEKDTIPTWISDAIDDSIESVFPTSKQGWLAISGALNTSGDYIILADARNELTKGRRILFSANVATFGEFSIGNTAYAASIPQTGTNNLVTINGTNIIRTKDTNVQTFPHGLTMGSGRIVVIIEQGLDLSKISLYMNGQSYSCEVEMRPFLVGIPYVVSNGLVANSCELKFTATDLHKNIWIFGDSYVQITNTRWPYYLNEKGYLDNVLLNGYPGEGSQNDLTSFSKLLGIGVPKIAVWCLGMNDGSDADANTPSSVWLTNVQQFITYCQNNGITPILATIPNVPSISNLGKNAWVRSSGYRYIDFAKAVGASDSATWYDGTLSSDNVHPSASGAKLLASQVLIDFPEIMVKQ